MKRPGFLKRGEKIRLQSFLARSGVASRRAAEEMITHGRIAVNGETVTAMGVQVVPGVDRVEVDGEEVKVAPTTWLALHKPTGYVTTRTDPFGRETVYALLPEKYHGLFHVGRLDRDSEGLLLLTNDGDLAHKLMHPAYGVQKTYLCHVQGPIPRGLGRQLRNGIELEDGPASVDNFRIVDSEGRNVLVEVVIHEGRKHVVRRLLDEVGHPVQRLVRTAIGDVRLGDQRPGRFRPLTRSEVGSLYRSVGM